MDELVNMDTMPLRWGHFRVLITASIGQFLGTALATLVGVVMPLIQICYNNTITTFQLSIFASIELLGILCGCLTTGYLSKRFGYLIFFIACPSIVMVTCILAYFADNPFTLIPLLFLMGFGIGGEYSLDPDYISDIMPLRWRLMMVGVAKASAALGGSFMALICYILLKNWGSAESWNRLFLVASLIALVMILSRIGFIHSPGWLVTNNRIYKAEQSVRYFLGNDVELGNFEQKRMICETKKSGWATLFNKRNRVKTILGCIPWACEGVCVYGVGIFTPILLISLKLEAESDNHFMDVLSSIKLTFILSIFTLLGFSLGLLVVKSLNHLVMQCLGFIISSLGMLLVLIASAFSLHPIVAIAGFIIFKIFLNTGPHLITFILPTQIFSIEQRDQGVSLSAAAGKVGAILGVFSIPVLMHIGGSSLVLTFIIFTGLLGAVVTAYAGRKIYRDEKAESWKF